MCESMSMLASCVSQTTYTCETMILQSVQAWNWMLHKCISPSSCTHVEAISQFCPPCCRWFKYICATLNLWNNSNRISCLNLNLPAKSYCHQHCIQLKNVHLWRFLFYFYVYITNSVLNLKLVMTKCFKWDSCRHSFSLSHLKCLLKQMSLCKLWILANLTTNNTQFTWLTAIFEASHIIMRCISVPLGSNCFRFSQ